jgi:predicted RNase H-like nuclease (RuvC/YqgF family)
MHQQQHVGAAFTEEDEGAQQQEQHLAASEAMVAELQKQLAEAQEHGQLLQQLILQQHVEKQSLEQQVEQLQAFAQQQQDKLAHSEEIISRMQSLAGRLATIR